MNVPEGYPEDCPNQRGKMRLHVESDLDDISIFDDVISVDDLHETFLSTIVEIVALQIVIVADDIPFDKSSRQVGMDLSGTGHHI